MLSVLGHLASFALLSSLREIPGLLWISRAMNYFVLIQLLDVLDRGRGRTNPILRNDRQVVRCA